MTETKGTMVSLEQYVMDIYKYRRGVPVKFFSDFPRKLEYFENTIFSEMVSAFETKWKKGILSWTDIDL